MSRKVLITLHGNEVAPRFDLTTEVLIAAVAADGSVTEEKTLVLPRSSAEKLCHMVLTERVGVVVCGAMEQEFYDYLTWKRVNVIDSVVGSYRDVLRGFCQGLLKSGDLLLDIRQEEQNGDSGLA